MFLALTYFILFAMHAWAAVASQYESYSCVYCFSNYLSFFDPLGILLVVIVFSEATKRKSSMAIKTFVILLVLVLSIGIGFSIFESIGREILYIPVPRMRDGQFLPGTTALVDLIANKFGLALPVIKRSISSAIGLFAGIAALLAAFLVWRRAKRSQTFPDFAHILINTFLVTGFVLAPLANARGSQFECKQDLIAANEQIGAHLARVIPPNSLVYWDGGLSFAPMVYVPNVRIFPPQINGGYTYRTGGDTETLFRLNHWNDELKEDWKNSADIFIIEVKRYSDWKDFLNPQDFQEYAKPSIDPSCNEGSGIRIFHRIP